MIRAPSFQQVALSRLYKFNSIKLAIALPLIIFAFVEAGRIIWAWYAVQNAARFGIRYAVTQEFDPRYCIEAGFSLGLASADMIDGIQDCRVPYPETDSVEHTASLMELARLPSIIDAVRIPLAGFDADGNFTQVTICSNRPGFVYDSRSGLCLPKNDAGRPGDTVTVRVAFSYPLGSSIGADIRPITFTAARQGVVEKFQTAQLESLPGAVAAESDGGNRLPADSALLLPAGDDRKVIVSGELQLLVKGTEDGLSQAVRLVENAGGYVASSEVWYNDELQYAKAVLRVPASQFRVVVDGMKQSATRVVRENVTGNDVTEEYVDLQSRLSSLQATAERVKGFLGEAENVEEALRVNRELAELETQVEQVKGRIKYLDNRVEFAVITVSFEPDHEPDHPLPPPPKVTVWQPAATFERAATFLATALVFLGDLLIWALVVGLPFVLLFGGLAWILERLRRRKQTPGK